MAEWKAEERLYFDIAHALRKVKIPGIRNALTDGGSTFARYAAAPPPPMPTHTTCMGGMNTVNCTTYCTATYSLKTEGRRRG